MITTCSMITTCRVNGKIVGKQRPRSVIQNGRLVVYTPKKTKQYEAAIRKAYTEANEGMQQHTGWISVTIYANFAKTKAEKQRKQLARTKKPDIDNIAKTVLDALNGVAYPDDKEVAALDCLKVYAAEGDEEHLLIMVQSVEGGAGNGQRSIPNITV